MAFPSFASPSLEDASITYSVKGFSSQYVTQFSSNTSGSVSSSGVISSVSGRYYSNYLAVVPGTYLFIYDSLLDNRTFFTNVCFFDSDYSVVSGGRDTQGYYIVVPSDASYCIITTTLSSRSRLHLGYSLFPLEGSESWRYVFHSIDNITFSDGKILIPYQTFTYTSVFLDFEFYPNNFYAESFSLDVFSYLTASYIDGKYVMNYLDGTYLTLYRYFDDSSGATQYEFLDDSINNPASFNEAFNNRVPFRGFRLYIPISYNGASGSVSSNLNIELSNFMLDSHSTQMVQEIKSIQELLSDYSLEHLTDVSLSDAFNNIDYASDTLENTRFRAIFDSFYGYGIIPTLIVLSLSIAFLGYLLYGKSG